MTSARDEYIREWQRKNKEKCYQATLRWRAKNKERFKAKARAWREKNRGYSTKWSKKNPGKMKEYQRRHREIHPPDPKKIAEWSKNSYERRREKVLAQKKGYHDKNKDSINARRRATRHIQEIHEAKRRAKKSGVSIQDEKLIAKYYKSIRGLSEFTCYYCKTVFPISSLHRDHVIPLKHSGAHSLSNIALSCKGCNLRKQGNLPSRYAVNGQSFLNL